MTLRRFCTGHADEALMQLIDNCLWVTTTAPRIVSSERLPVPGRPATAIDDSTVAVLAGYDDYGG